MNGKPLLIYNIDLTDRGKHYLVRVILLFSIGCSFFLCVYRYYRYSVYRPFSLESVTPGKIENYFCSIDSFTDEDIVYRIEGYVVRKNEGIEKRQMRLIIVNDDGSAWQVPTDMLYRYELSDLLNSEPNRYRYWPGAFSAAINKKYVSSANSRLYMLYQNNDRSEILDLGPLFENSVGGGNYS